MGPDAYSVYSAFEKDVNTPYPLPHFACTEFYSPVFMAGLPAYVCGRFTCHLWRGQKWNLDTPSKFGITIDVFSEQINNINLSFRDNTRDFDFTNVSPACGGIKIPHHATA
mgnify:CR=1 FL=1